MDEFIKITGWIIAILSLGVNIIQLIQNTNLKNEIKIISLNNKEDEIKQKHTGIGDNIYAKHGNIQKN